MDGFVFRHSDAGGLEEVRLLWHKLKDHHMRMSVRFGSKIERKTFDARKQELLVKCGEMRVDLVSTVESGLNVAYCISSVAADGKGEVDSLFVEEGLRGKGIGAELMKRALAWFEELEVKEKIVSVLHENDRALEFYQRFDFHPITMIMQQSQVQDMPKPH